MQPSADELMLLALISGTFALLGALGGTIGAGLFGLRAKRNEYVNDYYKTVIQRRINVYEHLENAIVAFKTSVVDGGDDRPYHFPFSKEKAKAHAILEFHPAMSQGLWLSDEAFSLVRSLNRLLLRMPPNDADAIKFGKAHYQEIAKLRASLEQILVGDMLEMHDVKKFLTRKRAPESGFSEVQVRAWSADETA